MKAYQFQHLFSLAKCQVGKKNEFKINFNYPNYYLDSIQMKYFFQLDIYL